MEHYLHKPLPYIPDQCVDLCHVYIIELFYSLLDLQLIGTQVHNEHQCVVVLNLLHGRLRGEWVLDDAILVQLGTAGNALAWVLGAPLALEGLGSVEVDGGAHFGLDFGVRPLQHRLLGLEGLGLSLRDLTYREGGAELHTRQWAEEQEQRALRTICSTYSTSPYWSYPTTIPLPEYTLKLILLSGFILLTGLILLLDLLFRGHVLSTHKERSKRMRTINPLNSREKGRGWSPCMFVYYTVLNYYTYARTRTRTLYMYYTRMCVSTRQRKTKSERASCPVDRMEPREPTSRSRTVPNLPWIRFTTVVIFLVALDSLVCMILWLAGGTSSYLEHSVRDFSFSNSTFDLAALAVGRGLLLFACFYYLERYILLAVFARGRRRKLSSLRISRACRAGIFVVAVVSVLYVAAKGSYIIDRLRKGNWNDAGSETRMHVSYKILCVAALSFPVLEIVGGVASWYFLGKLVHVERVRLLVNAENGEEEEEEETGGRKRKVNLKRLILLAKPVSGLVSLFLRNNDNYILTRIIIIMCINYSSGIIIISYLINWNAAIKFKCNY